MHCLYCDDEGENVTAIANMLHLLKVWQIVNLYFNYIILFLSLNFLQCC